MTHTKEELLTCGGELFLSLISCKPSASADSLDTFIDIQEEQECFSAACVKAGYTIEDIEDLTLS